MNLQQQILQYVAMNPQLAANNPRKQHMIEILKSGNREAGEQLANNLLQSWGVSKDEFMQEANTAIQSLMNGGSR